MPDMPDGFKPRRLRRPGVARRAAILKAAAEIFLEQGYERTSIAEITARAGGSRTLIYDQFGDKAGLFRAVIVELCQTMLAPVDPDAQNGRPPRVVLIELGRQFLHSLLGDDVQALSRIMFTEGPRHPDIADIFFSYGYDAGYDRLAGYLTSIAPAKLATSDLRSLCLTFFSMVRGDAFDRRLSGTRRNLSKGELEAQIGRAVDWLLGQIGLGREASRSPG